MQLSKEEKQQYNRHLILDNIGEQGQLRLKNAKVLVIGAGGLGCPILQYLTAAGIGNIGIIDHDTIDQSNLQRQILYTHDDLGEFKAEVAASKLSRLNPFVKFEIHIEKVTSENALNLFSNYDIIVDGSDNFPTRYLVNDAAVLSNKPLVFGSIFKFEGQVSVFNYNNGPTYRCLFPTPPKAGAVPNCSEIGVLGVLPGIIGSLQANEVLKLILGLGDVLSGKVLTYNALSSQQLIFNFDKNESIFIEKLAHDYEVFCGISNEITEITFETYALYKENYTVLDVRTNAERQIRYIESLHIPLQELEERLHEIPQNKDLLVYCKSGVRSKVAIAILRQRDFDKNLVNLKNGLDAYS
ncbi:molybdopterin-synthase adenylyltransferase MoeB [Algibacter miyuki]|uniref:Molybdopterin-synthase adenylyltransferase MoeB n=1 Tax=Algibacter miyuki TaxID=1306933 RepID=A0ABV5GZA9_9FLAO|nr:molybdopterin-synthase adenylyltransferase MoeB [Algibacter miyuki]MDN3666826.1 molybdopterin-synthase adenylyltransferase MoeB [Algibacter miyuki]